jgi:hypothetical protein
MKSYQSTKQTVKKRWNGLIKSSKTCHEVESCLAIPDTGKIVELYMINRWSRRQFSFVLLVVTAALMILGIYHITTTLISISKKPISQETMGLNRAIESYVNACWLTKTSKDLTSCRIHLADLENQCKTNANYSQVIACQDPRLAQLVNEQSQVFTSHQ